MIEWIDALNISIAVAGLVVSGLGLVLSCIIRKLRTWNRNFFVVLFVFLNVYIGSALISLVSMAMPDPKFTTLSEISMFVMSFASSFLMPMLAIMIRYYAEESIGRRSWKRMHSYDYVITFFWGVYIILLFMTLFTDKIYYFTPDNIYHRGAYYQFLLIPPILIMIINAGVLIKNRKHLSVRQIKAMAVYILLPLICMIIQMLTYGVMIILVGASLAALYLFGSILTEQVERFVRQTEENADQKVQLLTLQMRPHFICNTLLSIYYLCGEDSKRAQKVVLDFTDYLQKNYMAMTKASMVKFNEELEHVKAYIAVEKVRYEDGLEMDIDTPDTDFMIPPLTLQPIVENCVKHGIDPTGKKLCISIRTERKEDNDIITVEDNGCSSDTGEHHGTHIAIENIRKRLTLMCNGSFEIADREGGGKIVKIMIPVT